MADDRLTLIAGSAGDVPVVSALMQDAIVAPADIAFDRRGRRLVLVTSRFRWEAPEASRIRSALRIETVLGVQRRNWPAGDTPLDLLAVTASGDEAITLDFAGGTSLRAQVECIDLLVEDLGEAWPARRTPAHDTDA